MFAEYSKLKECWVGRSYSPDKVNDNLIKTILYETEEDLQEFCKVLESYDVTVKRPEYDDDVDIRRKPQLLHARDHLQRINGKMYIGTRFEEDIEKWKKLHDNWDRIITMDNLSAPSIVRADRLYFDAVAITRKRYEYFKYGNPDVECVYERLSNRDFDIERHTDGVFCPVKEGVIIATPSARNLEYLFPDWDILYLDINTQDLNDMKMSKDIVWSPKHIPEEYIRWVGYSPETFFDVNCLQLDEKHLMVTRYNKQVFDFLKKHKVEPIIIPFRHRYLWDGGLHCMTFDYERE
tara:strand:- start:5 stop:883 length:879 start_codon:yes stop_codon:yes gene_type:complete